MFAGVLNSTVTMVTWLDTEVRLFVPFTEYRATAVLLMTVPGADWARTGSAATKIIPVSTESHRADASVLNRGAPRGVHGTPPGRPNLFVLLNQLATGYPPG